METSTLAIAVNRNGLDFNDALPQSHWFDCDGEMRQQFLPTRTEGRLTSNDLKQRLHNRLQEALYHLFPAGKIEGKTFAIGNIQGHAGDSLSVEISGSKAGLWHDFATGEGGDIFDLWGAVHGWNVKCDFPEIMLSIQEWLGIPARPLPERKEKPQTDDLGTPTGKWGYQDTNGNPIAYVYRFDKPDGGKQFRPWDVKTQRYKAPDPRPLYNQPGIARSDTIVLVEGEKCAEALISIRICATTAMNGANAPIDKTDWSPLRGKHVLVWPDQDAPGKAYADKVIKKLADLELASLALMTIPEDKPEKWDAADAVAEGIDVKAFMQACSHIIEPLSAAREKAAPEESTAIEPLPLGKQLEKAKDYPIEALGDLLGGAALDIYDKIQVPLAVCAQSVLANAALVVQAHIDIKLPFGQASPTSLYLVSVSESGARKSSSDKEASMFIKEREKELRQKHDTDLASYVNAKDAYDSLRRKILNDKSGSSQQDLENALNALGSPPTPPLDALLTVPEPTYEGICGYFMRGQPGIGLFSDEGGQFISGYGMDSDNKIKTAAGLSNLWGGEPIKRMRGGDGTIVLPGKRLSMHLMVQPGIVEKLLSDPDLLQQGLLSRLLVVFPCHLFGTRLSINKKTRNGDALKKFNGKMLKIARQELPLNPDSERNELNPRVLEMTPDTEAAFYQFSDAIELRLKTGGDLESIRGFSSKLAEQASRIAAIIAYAEDPDVSHLQKHHFDRGAILAEYYACEALRLFGNAFIPPYILKAEALLEWLKNVWPSKTTIPDLIALPDVCKFGPNKIRRKALAMGALKTLEDHGWLVKEKNGNVIDGIHRKDVWRIQREFFEDCVEKQAKTSTLANSGNCSSPESGDHAFLPSERGQETFVEQDNRYYSPLTARPLAFEENAEEWEGINI